MNFDKYISMGTANNPDSTEVKRIKILNIYCLVWMSIIFGLILMNLYKNVMPTYFKKGVFTFDYFRWDIFLGHFTSELLVLLVFFLNSKKLFNVARILYVIIVLSHFLSFSLFINPGRFVEYYFAFFAGLMLPIFKKNTLPFLFMVLSFFCFLSPYYFYVVYPQDIIDRLLIIPTFCLFLCIYLIVTYFKKLNLQNEALLKLERDKVIEDKNIIAKKESELRELNEFKTHFFVNLSHEIRTPLTLIQGYASRINFKESASENEKRIAIIDSQITQIQNIIDNILDLSKIDSNEFTINTSQVVLIPFLEKHYQEFKELFDRKGIQFDLQLEIPALAVIMDAGLISKSINNLLSNALKFTPENGKVILSVWLNTELEIRIEDNGIGIPDQDIARVFDRFYQSKNDITKSQGSGIGLSFTKSILEKHQFAIDLISEPFIATVFTIKIPREAIRFLANKIPLETYTIQNQISPVKTNFSSFNTKFKKRVLLVEDNDEMRNFIKMVLHQFEITEAVNGGEALQILQDHTFDIVVTDYMMPVLDGEGLVTEMKKQDNKTPIIVLTARTDYQGKLNMLRLGVDGYLNKPFVEEELLLLIQKAVESTEAIDAFEPTLNSEEKEWLHNFSQKFNVELNDYISQNLSKPVFGVEDVASHFLISKSTLNRKTKAVLGQTTQEIISEARLQKAKALLKENPYATKKEIAESVGINNSSYFFNKLKKRFAIEAIK